MKKNGPVIVIIFFAALIGITYFVRMQEAKNRKPLRVYVPCGMTIPFKELELAYEKQYPGVKVETTFDNSNVLIKLITDKGNTPDVFISPGKKEIALLEEKGFIEQDSVKPFGNYELILIVPSKADKVKDISDLLNESVRTIAIANPDFNSIGDYASQALKSLGYWDKIQNKVLLTNTPIEALSYVAASKADAGIHYNACPFETSPDKVAEGAIKITTMFPGSSHEPIHSYAGILKDGANKDAAKNFVNFMFSKKGEKILKQYGLAPFGSKTSNFAQAPKVTVEAYYPFNEEHIFMKDYLESLPEKYQGKVKVECIDFRNDEGYVRWRKTGLACGGVLINGQYKFKLESGEVEFLRRMDDFWKREDLEKAINSELEKN